MLTLDHNTTTSNTTDDTIYTTCRTTNPVTDRQIQRRYLTSRRASRAAMKVAVNTVSTRVKILRAVCIDAWSTKCVVLPPRVFCCLNLSEIFLLKRDGEHECF